MKIQQAYEEAARAPSDINEHMPKLYDLARQCQHVTEFGIRYAGGSTLALLAGLEAASEKDGKRRRLVSWDIEAKAMPLACRWLEALKHVDFQPRTGNTHEITTEPTDFLFIDTDHTFSCLTRELARHGAAARRWLGFHDTWIFGTTGGDGTRPGLLGAIEAYRKVDPTWKPHYHTDANNGLTILERGP